MRYSADLVQQPVYKSPTEILELVYFGVELVISQSTIQVKAFRSCASCRAAPYRDRTATYCAAIYVDAEAEDYQCALP